jgi:hypothetical protein
LFEHLFHRAANSQSVINLGLVMTAITAGSVALLICAELP